MSTYSNRMQPALQNVQWLVLSAIVHSDNLIESPSYVANSLTHRETYFILFSAEILSVQAFCIPNDCSRESDKLTDGGDRSGEWLSVSLAEGWQDVGVREIWLVATRRDRRRQCDLIMQIGTTTYPGMLAALAQIS